MSKPTLGLVDSIVAAARADVEIAGFTWRVRKITSGDILAAGQAYLTMIPEPSKEGDEDAEPEAEDPIAMLKSSTPEQIDSLFRHMAVVVSAGTVCVKRADDPDESRHWEPLNLVADGDTIQGRQTRVADLPLGVEQELFNAIISLSMGEGAKEALARFRGESADGAAGGQDREAARQVGT